MRMKIELFTLPLRLGRSEKVVNLTSFSPDNKANMLNSLFRSLDHDGSFRNKNLRKTK
jgi:hypothetical protein